MKIEMPDSYYNSVYDFYVEYGKELELIKNYFGSTLDTVDIKNIEYNLNNVLLKYSNTFGLYRSKISTVEDKIRIEYEYVKDSGLGDAGHVRLSDSEVLSRCRWIVSHLGDGKKYEDELLLIELFDENEMTITRQSINFNELRVDNPVIFANGLVPYRFHGETCYLTGRIYLLSGKDDFDKE